jgi:hypothetical protein
MIGVCAAAIVLPSTGTAQRPSSRCQGTMTPVQCVNLLITLQTDNMTASESVARNSALDAAEAESERKPTGALLPGSTNLSIADFIPRFATAIETPGLQTVESFATVLSVPLSTDGPAALQLGLTVNKPEVYPALLDSVPAHKRDSVRARLERDITDHDDLAFTLSVNREDLSWGRRFDIHANGLSSVLNGIVAIVEDSLHAAGLRTPNEATIVLGRIMADTLRLREDTVVAGARDVECIALAPSLRPLDCYNEVTRATLNDAMDAFVASRSTAAELFEREYERISFARVADLVNNQPQMLLSIKYEPRHWRAGPSDLSAMFRVEYATVNMNELYLTCSRTITLDCFRTFVSDSRRLAALRRNLRGWLAAELNHRSSYEHELPPADSTSLELPGVLDIQISAGIGAYLDGATQGTQNTRLDAALTFAFHEEDHVRPERRLTATATLTQRVNDNLSTSFALHWANRPEFLNADVKKLGATIGFRLRTSGEMR